MKYKMMTFILLYQGPRNRLLVKEIGREEMVEKENGRI